ncbi:YafY family protein [Curtobacterium sp. MCBD17_030]|uniref:helix-turn-helix transcriptional regulator n=1 Tax=Curtobacterium sp. MCBD17_030 TaxID=2175649 RepID=UPI000D8BA30F|nr:WYL domain-containing protein [Curtobacterium sp. MCBD17_030]PYY34394.1 transcriptional regulator [Curtobacterium sp. MCBD17_030]
MPAPSSRLLSLLSLLQVRREWSGNDLGRRLDVSPRTVRRDVDRLRGLGYRVDALRGPAGGYRLSAGSDLPPLLFDDDQAVAIALALAVAPASGADIAEAAARALTTVRQVMPSRLRHRIDAVQVVTTPGAVVVDPAVLVAVSEAVRTRTVLRFGYMAAWPPGAEDDRPPRRVEPHALLARAGRWYLLAWDTEAVDWRTYRVDRIAPKVPTGLPFVPRAVPGGDPAAFVAARFRGADGTVGTGGAGGGGSAWPCVGTAVLQVSAHAIAPYVAEDAVLEDLGDGTCRLTTGSWSWTALAAVFAGFDADFAVTAPAALRDAVVRVAARLAAAGTRGAGPA